MKKRIYIKPTIGIVVVEEHLMQDNYSGWDFDEDPEGEVGDGDDLDWGENE